MHIIVRSANKGILIDKLQTLRKMMLQLKNKATDIRDEVQYQEFQARKKRKGEVNLWLQEVKETEEKVDDIETQIEQANLFNHSKLSNLLDRMTTTVEELLKRGMFPRGLVLDDFRLEGIELVTEELVGSTPIVVHDDIWSRFLRGESRVGIYGMGGVGKTSVAMHINNKVLTDGCVFNHVFYVTVSRNSSVYKLQRDIAKAFEIQLRNDCEMKRAAELSMALKRREKSLLILDDVWEEIPMEKVGVAIAGDGCKLLMTTRYKNVCHKMNCNTAVEMKPLSYDEAWTLFVKEHSNYKVVLDKVEVIAREIVKECSGLPLGIITVARCMRGVCDECEWRATLRKLRNPSISQHDMEHKVFNILQITYDQLDDMKKRCFLYCAFYPEDHIIRRVELISHLIAEGLVDGSSRQESEDVGHTLINALENASLLESTKSRTREGSVKMHDLVRDMAINIMRMTGIGIVKAGKALEEVPRKLEWTGGLMMVSLMFNHIGDIGDEICPECPKLSVLTLRRNPLKTISNSFFVHMAGLTFLDLSDTEIRELPNSVSNLCNLNALWLSRCRSLLFIPSLEKLGKLTELDLGCCSSLNGWPCGILELVNLRRLNVDGTSLRSIPEGLLSKLLKLERFWSSCRISTNVEELIKLKHLEGLKLYIDDIKGFNQCVRSGCFERWQNYYLLVGSSPFISLADDRHRVISVCGYRSIIETAMPFLVPRNVQILEFMDCSFGASSLVDALPTIHGACELMYCKLERCVGIKSISLDKTSTPFEGVRNLVLDAQDNFGCLVEGDVKRPYVFRRLRALDIRECPNLKKLGLLIQELPNLDYIFVRNCVEMEELFAVANETGDDAIQLPNLCRLQLINLPKLRSICRSSFFSPKLIKLSVTTCPKLKRLGLLLNQELRSLDCIYIEDCEQMEEIFAMGDEAGDDEILLPKLRRLHLVNLPELRCICKKTIVCNSLKRVKLEGTSDEKLNCCPISIPMLSVSNDHPRPVLEAKGKPTNWWISLRWTDPTTLQVLEQLDCLQQGHTAWLEGS